MKIERGDLFLADLDPTRGREIQKTRPVLVVSNDIANEFSGLVTVAPLTSKNLDRIRAFEVPVPKLKGMSVPSKILIQQIRTLDKKRLFKKLAQA
ncbi:MAG TPA: type II toxin-antitoxin system PemK/MazF family toxin, partial [Pseudobdellovibrionaceae bacterium]|nr:type II toxin-antitoxin system PemK/MazF family toxin [Pseudobdellovibrionaceae bacterium]